MTPGVNVLNAASRSDHPQHNIAFSVLNKAIAACADGASLKLKLMPMVMASFLPLVTNPKFFVQPMAIKNAIGFLDALLAVPGIETPSGDAEWLVFRDLLHGRTAACQCHSGRMARSGSHPARGTPGDLRC